MSPSGAMGRRIGFSLPLRSRWRDPTGEGLMGKGLKQRRLDSERRVSESRAAIHEEKPS